MRKSVVFVLVLTMMFFIGTSIAGAGIAPILSSLDIKPQSCPNPLNTKQHGVLPVAILGTAEFNVRDIDPSSIQLWGIGGPVVPISSSSVEDVATPYMNNGVLSMPCEFACTTEGPDGFDDLTFKFYAQDVIGVVSDSLTSSVCMEIMVTGNLLDGTPFATYDSLLLLVK